MRPASRKRVPKRAYPHQLAGVQYLRENPHAALFWQMRVGKTLPVIRRLREVAREQPRARFLIVGPNSVIPPWLRELESEGERDISLLLGSRVKRLAAIEEGSRWNLMNREGYRPLPEIATIPWDALVCDESIFLKNPKAQVSQFFCDNFREVPRRIILTGKPNPEGDLDFFQQFKFLFGDFMGYDNYWKFRGGHCQVVDYKWHLFHGARQQMRKWVGQRSSILRRKDVGPEVEKVYEQRYIEMPKKIRKLYNTAERDFFLEFGDTLKVTKYAMTRFAWMRQLCGGFLDDRFLWDGKYQEVLELLKGELAGEQVVIWFAFNRELKHLAALLGKKRVTHESVFGEVLTPERRLRIHRFRKGRSRVLLAQVACAEFSEDFSVANTAIYFSGPMGLSQRVQSEDRILQLGKGPLLYLDLMVEKSVDEDVFATAQEKEGYSNAVLRACQRIREGRTE
jgi:SNF2 family DNA or RNA helicase